MKLFSSSQNGRSMIEMLGVLAIVGILSVGGIAGFSKAMRTYKVNKVIEEYSLFINDILSNKSALRRASKGATNENRFYLAQVFNAMKILPATWAANNILIYDSMGHTISDIYVRNNNITFAIAIFKNNTTGQSATQEAKLFCQHLITDIAMKYADSLETLYIWQSTGGVYGLGYGNNFCNNTTKKCLTELKLPTIIAVCDSCVADSRQCSTVLEFYIY